MKEIKPEPPLTKEENQKLIQDAMARKYPEQKGWFRVGGLININGIMFRIKGVKPTELRLKLIPKPKGSS